MALEDLLRVLRVDRDFLPTRVITGATELAVDANLGAGAFHFEWNAALRRHRFQRRLGLQSVNVDVATTVDRDMVLEPIVASYPQATIAPVENPSPAATNETWSLAVELRPELYPILRHAQFEDLLNHTFADPVSGLLRSMLRDPDINCRIEITLAPDARRRCHQAREAVKLLDRAFFRNHHRLAAYFARHITRPRGWFLAWLLGLCARCSPQPNHTTIDTSTSRLHEREENLQAAADKLGGHLFEASIQLTVTGPRMHRRRRKERLHRMAGAFGTFTKSRLATFAAGKRRRDRKRAATAPSFLLSHEEVATLWHPPTEAAQAERMQTSDFLELEAPAMLYSEGENVVILGRTRFRDNRRLVGLAPEDRRRHLYLVGKTGMGKTTLLQNMLESSFWMHEFAAWSDNYRTEAVAAIQNKLRPFVVNSTIRAIVTHPNPALDFRRIMDEGKVLIVNLSKGWLGEDNSTLLGALIVTSIQQAAMTRADIPETDRKDFSLYVDEFQNFTTGSFASVLSDARKFRLSLIVAHQYLSQLNDETSDAVFGNVGSIVAFQVGSDDAERLAEQLGKYPGQIAPENLTGLPKYTAYVRLLIDGMPSKPFSMQTLPPMEALSQERAEIIRRVSQRRFAGQRSEEPIPV